MAQPEVSRYEQGLAAPSEEILQRMANAARFDWPVVAQLRQYYTSLLDAHERQAKISTPRPLDFSGLVPMIEMAIAPYLIELELSEPPPPSMEEEYREAEYIWGKLEQHPIPLRRTLLEAAPKSRSYWTLILKVCEKSLKVANEKPDEALELAELALLVTEKVRGDESWRSRLKGYCWAHIAKARRTANDPTGADEAVAQARKLWRMGGGEPMGGRPEPRLDI